MPEDKLATRGRTKKATRDQSDDDESDGYLSEREAHLLRLHDHAPLIDRVTNSWRDAKQENISNGDVDFGLCDLEDERSLPNTIKSLARSPKFRRLFLLVASLLFVLYMGYRRYILPPWRNDWVYTQTFMAKNVGGSYGIAKGGHFEGTRIKDLDPQLLPGGKHDTEGKRRLVFVGDIHGCKTELDNLLKKIDFNEKHDHLIATGDIISKGPDSIGVLDELIRLNADSVRGNHEDRLLEVAKTFSPDDASDDDVITSKGAHKDRLLLKHLHNKHMNYLQSMPLILRIPALPSAETTTGKSKEHIAEEILVVHAGLVPHIPLKQQDPYMVMNMRSIDHKTHVPSEIHSSKQKTGQAKPWFDLWNWYNDRVFRGRSVKDFFSLNFEEAGDEAEVEARKPKRQVVVYGHDSKTGLQVHRWSMGLDTRCVKGGKLTAMVLDARGAFEVVSVGCKDYHP